MSDTNILIVDDEPYLAEALKFVLSREGYEVIKALDGEEALEKIAIKKPLIMFLDVMMPKKNGYEVCEIIKNTNELKDIYVIMLSAKGWDSDKVKGLSVGANDYMSKPYSPKDVISRVKKVIEELSVKS